MKFLLPFAFLLSLNTFAENAKPKVKQKEKTTVKQETLKNGDVKTIIETKGPGGDSTTVMNNNKDEEAKMKKMYNDIAKCELKILSDDTPMGKIEMQTHGLTKGHCKYTQKVTAGPGQGQLVTCNFAKSHLKEIETKGMTAFVQYQTDESVCLITDLQGKKFE